VVGASALLDRYGTADALPGRKGPWLIHPVLIHAELHVAPDERLTTTVEALEREWLAGTDHEQRQLLRC